MKKALVPLFALAAACSHTVEAPTLDALVLDLESESIEVREQAKKEILRVGIAALPSLRRAVASGEALLRAEAQSLIPLIDPDLIQRDELLRTNMPANLIRYPLQVATPTAGFYVSGIARDQDTVLYTMAWNYLTRPYVSNEPLGGMRFDVQVENAAGQPLALNRCGICSPKILLVKNHTGPLRVRVTGVQSWFTRYPVELANPRNGESRNVEGMTLEVAWPRLILKSDTGWDGEALRMMNPAFDYELKPGARSKKPHQFNWVRMAGGCGDARDSEGTWCECTGGPANLRPSNPEKHKKLTYWAEAKYVPIEDVAVIKVTVWKPLEIPFDFTVDVQPTAVR